MHNQHTTCVCRLTILVHLLDLVPIKVYKWHSVVLSDSFLKGFRYLHVNLHRKRFHQVQGLLVCTSQVAVYLVNLGVDMVDLFSHLLDSLELFFDFMEARLLLAVLFENVFDNIVDRAFDLLLNASGKRRERVHLTFELQDVIHNFLLFLVKALDEFVNFFQNAFVFACNVQLCFLDFCFFSLNFIKYLVKSFVGGFQIDSEIVVN